MKFPLLIDGNNLLHAARDELNTPDDLGRYKLCQLLGSWAERFERQAHIVFDGPPPPGALAEQIAHPAIRVSYSGSGVSADSALIALIQANPAARQSQVVSSDREVRNAARAARARTVRADEFWADVMRDLARPRRVSQLPEEKKRGQTPDATEAWLREFGIDPPAR